jgi:hypothetical protein
MGSSEPILLGSFVTNLLNDANPIEVATLVDEGYRDHDPLRLPPFLVPSQATFSTRSDLVQLVRFLGHPSVDIRFHLEDAFQVNDRIAYRLFGAGTLSIRDLLPQATSEDIDSIARGGRQNLPQGKILGESVQVDYQCTGIFRIHEGRMIERWGLPWIH